MVDNSGFAAGEAKINLSSSTTALNPLKKGKNYLVTGGVFDIGFDLTSASYSNNSFSVASQTTNAFGMAFNTDGTKMFIVEYASNTVYEYNLSTGFDITSASYSGNSFSVASQATTPVDIAFNTDGTKMFILGLNNNTVYEYSLSTGFDITSASYSGNSFSIAGQDTNSRSIAFNTDGTKMFMVGTANDTVYEYNLSTGFDITSASYSGNSFSVASQDILPHGMAFNTDGTKMFMVGDANDTVYEYSLSTGFDITSASYSGNSFSVTSQDTSPRSIAFNTDGTKMFILGDVYNTVYEYNSSLTALEHYLPNSPNLTDSPVKLFPSSQVLWSSIGSFTLYGNGNNITVLNLDGSFDTAASSILLDENVPIEVYYDGTNWVVTRE